jgi:hypothetical protein
MYNPKCRGKGLVRMVARSSGGGHRSIDNSACIASSGKLFV